jgi:sigma-B regulation protein RsbU (phosphoserine phosphatase)
LKHLSFLWIAASLSAQVSLEGPWRMTRQDSPSFALPASADGDWAEVQLPWKERPASGIFWLRKTVTLDAALPEAVLVVGGVASSYEVYVNGQLIGGPPGFGSRIVEVWQPRQFRLPGRLPSGAVTIALRCWEMKVWSSAFFDAGRPYQLGSPAAATAALDHFWIRSRNSAYPRLLISAAQVALGLYLLLVWRRDLLGLGFFLVTWGGLMSFYSHLRGYESHMGSHWNAILYLANSAGWIAWFATSVNFLCFSRLSVRFVIAPLAVILVGTHLLPYVDQNVNVNLSFVELLPLGLPLGFAAIRLWQGTYIGPALLVSAAGVVSLSVNTLSRLFGIGASEIQWQGFSFPVTPVAYLVASAWMSVEYLERLKRQRAERDRLAAEMDSARAVQTSLLSVNTLSHAGCSAEAVYRPALEVGGDFYELIAAPDGTMLVVVGDVSGKGLQAAMVVALALGALRNRHSSTPADLLAEMNWSLVQRKAGGFVTCIIARISPGGGVAVASAGHPSPFLAGREWTVPPGLPLGVTAEANYEEAVGQLVPGQALVLVSDGVVEAENAQRELFGFERTREISTKSATEIAEAARAWGQTDDITVVTVRRNA